MPSMSIAIYLGMKRTCMFTVCVFNCIITLHAFLLAVPPNVLAGNRSLLALEQESVTICFSIENASPEVEVLNIRWFFTLDGTSDTDSMDITDEAIIGDTTLTFSDSRLELSLRGLTQDAAGIYRLVATNPAGIAFDFTNLTIQGNRACVANIL